MIAIPGYQVLAKIYESDNSLVYRGRREQDNQAVILKVFSKEYPTPEELSRYETEYQLTRNLNLDSVVKAFDFQKHQNTFFMVLEDFGGESLKMLMASQKFTILGFLKLAIRITENLGKIHGANIIHKDINPSNIVFNPVTGEVKLIDLSISTILNRDEVTAKQSGGLEGTLAYMSPEQTGRMNRDLDYRTDFYSLGATFYELLTSRLPFEATDAMELVHCHIAKQPTPPHQFNEEIPLTLSGIVMKLLSKNAEERYQSAWGLKADLERCLKEYQTTEEISDFALGSQDISDKFQLPQKLYGRDQEIDQLTQIFDRVSQGATEMVLVAGYSGIGKSVLVQEMYKPVTEKGGYFTWGKFDQFQRSIPYSAVVIAFTELVRQLLTESEEKLSQRREKLLKAFGPNGQIIIDVIPEVELIVGTQEPVIELGPTEAQNRFNLVFQNFIRVFCQPEHPLVIFLDDLQWADSATLKLINLMMTDEDTHYLFFLGAYRDHEVSPTHPLMMTVDALRHHEARIEEIILHSLNLEQISQLIAETLHKELSHIQPLAKLVLRKTEGNPFFVNEFLKTLYQENLLTFQPPQADQIGGWQWDIQQIERMDITDNVVDLMIGKLRKLPTETQEILRLAACLGNKFDLNTLSLIYERESSETFNDMLPSIHEGLILPASESEAKKVEVTLYPLLILNYKFLHDRVQQAAYALIDDADKKMVHLTIGRMLLERTPEEYRADRIFELVDHLNVGRNLITEETEKIELAALNLEAGRKAKDATAYVAALQYLRAGMDDLGADIWETHYDLAFSLHKERADVEYLNGNFAESEAFISITLNHAKSVLEKTEVYNLLLIQYALRSQYEAGVKVGIKALALMDIHISEDEIPNVISEEIAQVTKVLAEREPLELLDAPEITDHKQRVTLKLLTNFAPSCYLYNMQLWTLVILKGAGLCLEFGYSPESAVFYPTYGVLLAAMFGQYKQAYEFGRLALKINQKWGNPTYKACAPLVLALNYWFEPLQNSNAIANEGYQSALESGDLQYAGYLLGNKSLNLFMMGKNSAQLLTEVSNYLQFTQKTENALITDTLIGLQFILCNLSKKNADQFSFDIDSMNEAQYIAESQQQQKFYSLCIYQIFKMSVLYLYGNIPTALNLTLETEKLLQFILGILPATDYNFYSSLIFSAAIPDAPPEEAQTYRQKIEKNQQQLKVWSENCPANFLAKYLLVKAELAQLDGQELVAIDLYDQAIEAASQSEFMHIEALANERAAQFWLHKNKEKFATLYLREAYYGYRRWGVLWKIDNFEENYGRLLVQNQPKRRLDPRTTAIHNTTDGGSRVLDFETVLKAAQTISSEIVLEKLLDNLMTILIENAGAQFGFLLLPRDGKMVISATASVAQAEVTVQKLVLNLVEGSKQGLSATQPQTAEDLPLTVINYVERTRNDVVLSQAIKEGRFISDPYIQSRQVKSLLCTPIINQGQLIGILYLENNLIEGAFTPDRLEVLRLLSSQASISLENALLYASLEQKVAERTQELHEKNESLSQTLRELQRTQAQLVQSEKMSSLGQMVAGVAHEINNPVSFIYGNLSPAAEYVQDILRVIDLYQEHYPNPAPEIQEEIDDIDLEFVVEDLQKLLDSMKVGAERIRNIILSLRNFSRLDEADMKPVDIHEGIESTLLILHNRLKASGERAGLEIVQNYAKLPQVVCYASQLNQVFMNLLTNAGDALKDVRNNTNVKQSGKKPTITITTELIDPEWVRIRIADNGPGIPETIQAKIFDPFFTTKPVGSGTGLGLSISYQIIVEKHGGRLSCVSTPEEGAEFIMELPVKPQNFGKPT